MGWITQDGITGMADSSASGHWKVVICGNSGNWDTCLSSASKVLVHMAAQVSKKSSGSMQGLV